MPKQVGLIKIQGTVDNLTFLETQDGLIVQKKRRFNADKLKNDPNYQQVRNTMQEFAIGSNAGTLFREAFTTEITKAVDNRMISRLTRTMIEILKTDPVNEWGHRKVQLGEMEKLVKFNFNGPVPMSATVKVDPQVAINRPAGQVTVIIPAHIPQELIAAPSGGVTHYRFFAAAAAIDFENASSISGRQSSANLIHDNNVGTETTLTLPLVPNSTLPIFIVLGVEFMVIVNGKATPNSKKESALHVLTVDIPA
jgi:hypothetical protein